jgi:pilus assembly protein CpaB
MRRTLLAIAAVLLATIGTTLLYVYVSTADSRAKAQVERIPVLVASNEMAAGTSASTLSARMTDVATFDLMPQAITDLRSIQGKVLTVKVFAKQQLTLQMFGEATTGGLPTGHVAISVAFGEAQRVSSLIKAGSTVNVYRLNGARAVQVLPGALVLSVDAKGIVTFDLKPDEVQTLLDGVGQGQLVLGLQAVGPG